MRFRQWLTISESSRELSKDDGSERRVARRARTEGECEEKGKRKNEAASTRKATLRLVRQYRAGKSSSKSV